jgi:hypothetical protein
MDKSLENLFKMLPFVIAIEYLMDFNQKIIKDYAEFPLPFLSGRFYWLKVLQ